MARTDTLDLRRIKALQAAFLSVNGSESERLVRCQSASAVGWRQLGTMRLEYIFLTGTLKFAGLQET